MAHLRVAALDKGTHQSLPREAFWVLPTSCASPKAPTFGAVNHLWGADMGI